MPPAPDKPYARICVRVFEDDYKYITQMAEATQGDVSANLIIRTIIHNYVNQIRDGERRKRDQIQQTPAEVEL